MKIKINHPMADQISLAKGPMGYSGENSTEIAFFLKGQWVVDPIPEFAKYHDGSTDDTAVYPWVPNKLIDEFLATWG